MAKVEQPLFVLPKKRNGKKVNSNAGHVDHIITLQVHSAFSKKLMNCHFSTRCKRSDNSYDNNSTRLYKKLMSSHYQTIPLPVEIRQASSLYFQEEAETVTLIVAYFS